MVDAMILEMENRAQEINLNDFSIDTIYFGGGTPSLLSTKDVDKIFSSAYKNLKISSAPEITLEANPDDIKVSSLSEWKMAGINRLSIGVQSFVQEHLDWMNRVHTASQAIESVKLVRKSGFENFSVDLIFGTPVSSDQEWNQNVFTLIDMEVPHIAAYALTVEPQTALEQMIRLSKKEPVDPEKQASQFLMLIDWLENADYEHYEISNFSKVGKRSKHNSSYWQGIPYIGIGPSAHSFDGKKRSWNISNNIRYISGIENNTHIPEMEILTSIQQLNEYIMTSLRTMEGLDLEYVAERFGRHFSEQIHNSSGKYEKQNHITRNEKKIALTKAGKLFADGIASGLFTDGG